VSQPSAQSDLALTCGCTNPMLVTLRASRAPANIALPTSGPGRTMILGLGQDIGEFKGLILHRLSLKPDPGDRRDVF